MDAPTRTHLKLPERRRQRFDVAFYMPLIGPLLVRGPAAPSGGAERQILMLGRELARRGWRVALISYQTEPALPHEGDGITILVQRRLRGLPRGIRAVAYLAELARVLWSADASTYVQRSAGMLTGYVAVLARLMRRRFVYSSANVVDFDYAQLASSRMDLHMYELGVRLAQRIVVQSTEQVELCRRRFRRRPTMIRSLAATAEQRTGVPSAFLWIGRAAHYKRPEAYLELARSVPEARFWMIVVPADPRGEQLVERLSTRAASIPNLELLAPRSSEELGTLIDRAVAVVNTADYEGMPNVFLEGWARGVPALAYAHDPDGVVSRHGLGAFAHGSPERLAEHARTMWRERSEQTEVAMRCRAYLEREHSLRRVADSWEDALELGGSRRGDPLSVPSAGRDAGRGRVRRPAFDVAFYMPWSGSLLVDGGVPPPGGAETQIVMLARELARRGWRVAMISYPTQPPLPRGVDGISLFVHAPMRRLPRGIDTVVHLLEMTRALSRVDASVYVQRTATPITGCLALLAKLRRRSFVYSSSSISDFDWGRSATSRVDLWVYELGLRLARRIVVQSPEQVELCRRRLEREPVMIPSLAAPAELRSAVPGAFLWAGRASAEKRPEVYVELARAVPEARFWMVAVPAPGHGEELMRKLSRAAEELPNLKLLASRPRAELGGLIDRAVAVVSTSEFEGMPNVFLEGWARGVPALAFAHDPDGVVVRESLGLFAEGSIDRLAEAARGMWQRRGDQSEVAARCRAYVEREHSVQPVVDAWERALGLSAQEPPTAVPSAAVQSVLTTLEPRA